MKVLLLNGSANRKGNTFTALSEIAKQLEKNGVESEIMQLGNKPVRGCIACGQGFACLLWSAQRCCDGCAATCFLLGCQGSEQASGCSGHLPPWWCYGCIPDAEHDLRDDEHACCHFTILEHRLRLGSWRGNSGHGGYADHAGTGRQHGLAAEEYSCRRQSRLP